MFSTLLRFSGIWSPFERTRRNFRSSFATCGEKLKSTSVKDFGFTDERASSSFSSASLRRLLTAPAETVTPSSSSISISFGKNGVEPHFESHEERSSFVIGLLRAFSPIASEKRAFPEFRNESHPKEPLLRSSPRRQRIPDVSSVLRF